MTRTTAGRLALAATLGLMLSGAAQAQSRSDADDKKAAQDAPSRFDDTRKQAVEIGSQPARDLGMSKREIPPVLEDALSDPYGIRSLKTCAQLAAAVRTLNDALGPDYQAGGEYTENRAGKLAKAGGKSVINSIIPFRSLVREITGAAPADRHMNAVVDAGLARRGFLRGVQYKQRCKTTS
ncbi:MAG: hypothetical protein KKE02_02780 [Alphaproteobacteria bacterium]|nr:hypothetical protein [Alphaproteobacteria bacterium]MBU1513396.1 hypothetical protein [Alphaproteobacteria bacterium]MBU2096388.1 hypothetical protein [Alphaproteobacteria bacterium]MBU2149920.1 hypothetical protein [Alphaproteobacteria bacterium]MBU2309882.1 hypothetical protein [Alphaproteobacteria bacterium]